MNIRLGHFILLMAVLLATGCVRKNFFAKTPLVNPEVRQKLELDPEAVDSVVVKAGKHYKRGFLHRIFWGTHYRPVWNAPVKVPVFDMDTTKGGLEIEKLGGGFQTTSLTLVDKEGFTYALRSLDKDPKEVLPKFWRNTFVLNILRDQISAINPYGALALPPMAKAAGIPHATPELVYVRPNANGFGEHEEEFSDRLFAIEEKYNDDRAITPALGNATDIVSSGKVLKNRYEDDDHFIDQLAFAKARLFDILVHDWDRHEGQWEWAKYEKKGENIYRPIPKDRDNVFYRFQDGIIPWIFSRSWAIRKFKSFDDEYNDVYALMINSRFIDERALSQVTRAQFDSLARELQQSITDDVIEKAVQQFPDSVYKLVGETTKRKLISRRNKLPEAANEFYELLAKEVLVVGTDLEDKFEVNRLDDERTEVIVRRESDDKVIYRRTFYRSETKLITLHGLAEDDKFDISGKVNQGIKIKIYGGRGEDEIKDTSEVKNGGKKTWVYDTRRGTELEAGPTTKDKRKNDVRLHAFDREGF
ncbi:hypothetical protein ABID22_003917 [Pontibacter aydingkolensis]|uniref:Uncharacterized protein n=1 Tax=Pontibacter aydingkolensis TaxID=1911536 RepID=A0ABS7CZG2_9BACT|nr:hypothetical protein [Pontibacter aydingkolensis]MBW7469202.1 hypothetical protein [Pontibacter aydingkolensis]